MPRGTLISESLRLGRSIDVPLAITKIWREDAGDPDAGQPAHWTLIEFQVALEHLDDLVSALADALEPTLGWYCDLHTDFETIVVFAATVFRYPKGDAAGHAAASEHARAMAVPESQIDWPE